MKNDDALIATGKVLSIALPTFVVDDVGGVEKVVQLEATLVRILPALRIDGE